MSSLAEAQRAAGAGDGTPLPPDPPVVAVLRKIDRGLGKLEEILLGVFLLALLVVGVLGAVKRNFLPPSPFWLEEAVRYSVFFLGLVGAALAAQSDRLFNIDMFTRVLGVRGKLVLKILTSLFTIWVCWMFMKSSFILREVALAGEEGELLAPETGILSLPIAMIAIMAHLALHALIALYFLVTGKTPPEMVGPQVPHA
jgi:TRAP-type C4-dicarboxylate transport system permease small subunit